MDVVEFHILKTRLKARGGQNQYMAVLMLAQVFLKNLFTTELKNLMGPFFFLVFYLLSDPWLLR